MKRNVMVMVAVAMAAAFFPVMCFAADKTVNIVYSGDLRGNITPVRG